MHAARVADKPRVAAEMVGKNVKMLMPPSYAVQHDSYMQRFFATGAQPLPTTPTQSLTCVVPSLPQAAAR